MRPGTEARARLRAAARSLLTPAILGLAYLLLRALFVALAAGQGLLTPDASVDPGLVALGAAALALRLAVLFVAIPLAVYRLIVALPARAAEPTSSPGARGTDRPPRATSGHPGR